MKIQILYGSQTGNAESISNILSNKINCNVKCLNDINIEELKDFDINIIILSTTGDGEFPDNANKFWSKFRKYNQKLGFNFILLGLGSTDYNNFCFSAKSLLRRLKKNDCIELINTEYADDAIGLEEVVDSWIEKVINITK